MTWLTEEEVAQRLRELAGGLRRLGSAASSLGNSAWQERRRRPPCCIENDRWGVPSGSAADQPYPQAGGRRSRRPRPQRASLPRRRPSCRVSSWPVLTSPASAKRAPSSWTGTTARALDGGWSGSTRRTLCQALGLPPDTEVPERRRTGPEARSRACCARRCLRRPADDAIWRFLDALAWNWLIAGTDAHAKNYSLLLAGERSAWRRCTTSPRLFPTARTRRRLRFAMKIGGEYGVFPYRNTWRRAAADLGIDPELVVARVGELAVARARCVCHCGGCARGCFARASATGASGRPGG